jgi:peptidyl-prolyl cis-trans isomerase D
MLKYMRTHATSWFIKILLGLIIVVFILWGMGSIRSKKETVVATVGGNHITRGEFDRTYQNLLEYYTKTFGQQVSPELLRRLNIKQQALDQLINTTIIQEQIHRIGLRVSETEVKDAIRQYPAFQRDGRFDSDLYKRFLGSTGLDNENFQRIIRKELANRRMMALIGEIPVIVTEAEGKTLYRLENEQINVSFVKIPPQAFSGQVTITQDELERYYAEHKEEFRTSAEVKVHYVRFSPQAYLQEATVSPQEVQEYYDLHGEQYQGAEKVRVRHILIGVSPEAGPEAVEGARKKAEKIRAEARRGGDFAALARTYSDDPSAAEGGDLGYFSRGEMDPSLERVVFSLGKGAISPVVRTRHGFHVVKVEDVQAPKTQVLDEVREEIVAHIKKEKAENLTAIHAEDAAYHAKNGDGLQAYADEVGLQVEEAGPFKPGESPKRLGARERFSSLAFTLNEGEVSSAFQDGEDYFVLQVVDKIPPQIPPLEEVKDRTSRALVSSSALELARATAHELLVAWKKGEGFRELVREHGLTVEQTGFFKRSSSSPPGLGLQSSPVNEITTLTLEAPWPEDIIPVGDAYVVAKLQDVREAEEKGYTQEKDTYHQRLAGLKERELVRGWLTAMRQEVDVEINQELLGQYR